MKKLIFFLLIGSIGTVLAQTDNKKTSNPLTAEALLGKWKVTKVSPTSPEDKCSKKLVSTAITFTEKEVEMSRCDSNKVSVKKFSYKIKKGKLEIYTKQLLYGMEAEVTYTNDGKMTSPKKAEILFWETGWVTIEKTK